MKRRLAREIVVQSLYQIEMNDMPIQQAIETLIEESQLLEDSEFAWGNETIEIDFIRRQIEGVIAHKQEIDRLLTHYLKGWKMDRLSRVDRQILRLAVFEMIFQDDVPPKAAINEAIELSKYFGSEESGKFVNGVMGKMIRELDDIRKQLNRPLQSEQPR